MNGLNDKSRNGDTSTTDEWLARAAHQYYVLGLTQNDVAKRLGVTRFKAHRMIATARERGMVRIEIDVASSSRLDLERQLIAKYGLSQVMVTPSDSTDTFSLSQVIGHYAASMVAPMIADDMTVALSWGHTLRSLAISIEPATYRNLHIVPLIGSLSQKSSIDRYEATTTLAQKLGGECYYLPSPIICDNRNAQKAIASQPMLQRVIMQGRQADLSLVSVGGENLSSIRETGILSDDDYKSVIAAGCIGNFLGRFIDENGVPIDHEINERIVGVTPVESKEIPSRILVSGGPHKTVAIHAVIANGFATGLITDEETAKALLEL
ncbi:MAG: sugar-binding transcriptional regulator [Hyphomicrobiales bacterium]